MLNTRWRTWQSEIAIFREDYFNFHLILGNNLWWFWFCLFLFEFIYQSIVNIFLFCYYFMLYLLIDPFIRKIIIFIFFRLPATSKNIRSVELTIERMGGASLNVLVRYKTRQITRLTTIAGVSFYPAVANSDFVSVEGTVRFVKNQVAFFFNLKYLIAS